MPNTPDDRQTAPAIPNAGAPLPPDELERLRELCGCNILDSDSEPAFDNLTALAARLLDTPIALISLVDEHRQWFKSRVGLDACETPREHAFCAFAILGPDVLQISDAATDPRTTGNPLVTGAPHIRAYLGAPLRLQSGRSIGTLCVIDTRARRFDAAQQAVLRDLAAQAAALIELRRDASERDTIAGELRTILDSVPSLIYFKDDSNTILNLNKPAADAMRMGIDEVIGHATEEFFPADDAGAFLEDDRQVLSTGLPKLGIEEVHEGGSGERRIVRTDKIPLKNHQGVFDRLVAIATDVTELRNAESRLSDTTQRLALAMQGSGQAAWDWNPITNETIFSDNWYAMMGYEQGDLPRVFDGWSTLVHPDDVEDARRDLEAHLAGERPVYTSTIRLRCRNGAWKWTRALGRIVERTADGRPERVTGMLVDIDAERRLQQELQNKNTELERFVYTASHDLKSPLVTILGFLGYIMRDLEAGEYGELPALAQRIERAATRMRSNIDGLLELSRIGRQKGHVEPVSLQDVVDDLREDYQQRLEDAGIALEADLHESCVLCDRTHAAQAVANLLTNAIKYGATAQRPRITIASKPVDDNMLEISVSDNGQGIEERFRDRIFELFERLSSEKNGNGIGLAIVRRVAEQYGGQAWVDSAPGEGATFRFLLPKAPALGGRIAA